MPRALHRAADVEATLVRAFLTAAGDCLSGAALAKLVGVSRVAVWGHLHKLESQGFRFTAEHSRGYRLTAQPAGLHPVLVRAHLPPATATTLFHPTVDSTNEEAERQLANGRAAPFVVLASAQTQGRGRFGRVWHSPAEGNLYLSFAFRPELPPERMHLFTLWMGLNLCDLLAAHAGVAPGLKWPNDLYFGTRKVGGMLTEARIDADHTRDLVFGLGLNVNTPDSAWPREIAPRATTLAREAGRPLDLNRLAAAIVERILAAYDGFVARPPLDEVADLWKRHDILAGRHITVVHGHDTHTGTARGIDNEGSLLLRTEAGKTLRFRAGEVTLRKE